MQRIHRRIEVLGLADYSAYQAYLKIHPDEWEVLDGMCIITISRFYRDRGVFHALKEKVLPALAAKAKAANRQLRCWSAGCASGEEPYTLAILWEEVLAKRFPHIDFYLVATDMDAHMLDRARRGCYEAGSLRELPVAWQKQAFSQENGLYCIRSNYKSRVQFLQQDIRQQMPEALFDLILCRNLIGFYYDKELQTELYQKIYNCLQPEGVLVLGTHETLPADLHTFTPWVENESIYIRT